MGKNRTGTFNYLDYFCSFLFKDALYSKLSGGDGGYLEQPDTDP